MRTRSLGPVADLSKADPERASTFTEPPRSQQHEADTDDDHGGRIKSASIVFGSLFRTSLRALPAPRDFDDVMDGLGAIKSSEHEHEHEISSHDEDDDDLLGSDVESGAGGAVEPRCAASSLSLSPSSNPQLNSSDNGRTVTVASTSASTRLSAPSRSSRTLSSS